MGWESWYLPQPAAQSFLHAEHKSTGHPSFRALFAFHLLVVEEAQRQRPSEEKQDDAPSTAPAGRLHRRGTAVRCLLGAMAAHPRPARPQSGLPGFSPEPARPEPGEE